jgi:pteridine reductase
MRLIVDIAQFKKIYCLLPSKFFYGDQLKMNSAKIFLKKNALVTGASKRIGRAIALSLADNGYNIVVHFNNSKEDAFRLCREIEQKNVNAWPVRADLGKPEGSRRLIERTLGYCGSLSVLVNNASIFPTATLEEITLSDFNQNMLVNAWAPLCLSRAFAKSAKQGAIINILDARKPGQDRSHAAYSLSKCVLDAVTLQCATQFAPHIRVNGVAPGLILPPAGKDFSYLEKLKDRVPLKTYGNPQDIADAVVFLVKSRFITGQIVYIDGGRRQLGSIPA